jgi:hypothetical protein
MVESIVIALAIFFIGIPIACFIVFGSVGVLVRGLFPAKRQVWEDPVAPSYEVTPADNGPWYVTPAIIAMAVIALTLAVIAIPAHAQVSCQRIGQQVFCSDGSSASQIGNTTFFHPPPPVYQPAPIYQPYQAPPIGSNPISRVIAGSRVQIISCRLLPDSGHDRRRLGDRRDFLRAGKPQVPLLPLGNRLGAGIESAPSP